MNQVTEIITLILGISVLTLLINRSADSSRLIATSTQGLNSILRTITLQNNMFGSGYGGGQF